MTDALATAEAALEKGDRVAALDALLDAWRLCKAREIAQVIDVVSDDLGRTLAAIDPEAKDFHADWLRVEKDARACDAPRLLPGLWSDPMSTLGLRLERILSRGEDPRTGRAFLTMIERIPTTSSSNFSIWVRAFKAMPTMLDASVKDELLTLRKRPPKTKSQFWPKFSGWIDKLIEELPEPLALDKDDGKRVKAMLARARELAKDKPIAPPEAEPKEAKPASPTASLASAKACLAKGEIAQAVSHVLDAYNASTCPELAALLVKVSQVAPQENLPPAPPKAVQAAWLALEAKGRASDVPVLLETLEVGTFADIEGRLVRMGARPADPRVSMRMRASVREGKAGGEKRAYWSAVFDLLARAGDASDLDVIRRLGEGDATAVGRGNLAFGNGPLLRGNGARVAPAIADRIEREKKTPPSPAILAAIEEVAALVPSGAEHPDKALVAAIVANPDDDGPKLVYADKLTEAGDPRGELIVVQCQLAKGDASPAERKKLESREKALLKTSKKLLGPVVDLAFTGTAEFERGMLVAMKPVLKSQRQRELLDHPMVATVREVDLGWINEGDGAFVVLHPNLPSLRTVHSLTGRDVAAVSGSAKPLPLTRLGITAGPDAFSPAEQATIAEGRSLPAVRVLECQFWGACPEWLLAGDLVARLDRIEVGSPHTGGPPPILQWAKGLGPLKKRPEFVLTWAYGQCTLRDGVLRANFSYEKPYAEWITALQAARSAADELVLEGEWPDAAKAAIFA